MRRIPDLLTACEEARELLSLDAGRSYVVEFLTECIKATREAQAELRALNTQRRAAKAA